MAGFIGERARRRRRNLLLSFILIIVIIIGIYLCINRSESFAPVATGGGGAGAGDWADEWLPPDDYDYDELLLDNNIEIIDIVDVLETNLAQLTVSNITGLAPPIHLTRSRDMNCWGGTANTIASNSFGSGSSFGKCLSISAQYLTRGSYEMTVAPRPSKVFTTCSLGEKRVSATSCLYPTPQIRMCFPPTASPNNVVSLLMLCIGIPLLISVAKHENGKERCSLPYS